MAKLQDHIMRALDGSVVITDPFSFVYVDNIFPQDFYEKVCSLAPPDNLLALAGTKQTHKVIVESRYIFPLTRDDINILSNSEHVKMFMEWAKIFLMPVIGRKLGVSYDYNQKDLRGAFVRDEAGYFKRPHTDHPSKLFTLLLYMSHSPTGTTMLRPKQSNFVDDYGNDHPYKLFNEVVTYPFKPNSALAFVRTDNSFHCVNKVTSTSPRKSLHLHVWNSAE